MTRFYFIRHGQSTFNTTDAVDKTLMVDSELIYRGHEEAKQTAWCLSSKIPSNSNLVILQSPLKRATQTAAHFIDMLESDQRQYKVTTINQLHEFQPKEQTIPENLISTITTDDDESTFRQRVHSLSVMLRDLSKEFTSVVVFSHSHLLSCLIQYLMFQETLISCPEPAFKLYNCSITIVDLKDNKWNIVLFNNTDHLDCDD